MSRHPTRRSFLKLSGAFAASALGCGSSAEVAKKGRVKALVVGTGFGGAIAAYRLSQAGIEVTVLERGRRWVVTDAEDTFPSVIAPDRRAAWFNTTTVLPGAPSATFTPYAGLLEAIKGKNMQVITGAGVGGNSLVFGGIMVQPSKEMFHRSFPTSIDYETMDQDYYPRVAKMLRIATIPDDILQAPEYASTRIFIEQAKASGLNPELIQNAIDWDLVRKELTGEKKPSAILGEYNYGLNSGAKHSLDTNYLAEAEATGRVDLRPLHVVQSIAARKGGGYEVTADHIDEEGQVLESVTLAADVLFLGAGSLGTTRLLLAAKAEGGLSKLGNNLGEGWGNNGQILAVRGGVGKDTGALQGGPPSAFVRLPDHPIAPISIENGPGPFGTECQCLILICHGIPEGRGRLSWNAATRMATPEWDKAHTASTQAAFDATLEKLAQDHGGVLLPLSGVTGDDSTYHPLGGAVMDDVCDTFGRVLGYPGLYVTDGALIPGSTGCANPAYTIAAIAERCMDGILADDLA